MYVGCVICLFFMYKIFTLFFNQRWDSSVKYWLMSIIIYLISSSKDMGYICDKKGKKLSG